MSNLKILDCTLRDGGYINNWNFGKNNITNIIKNLILAKMDYIECGFLKQIDYNEQSSLFSSITDIEKILPLENTNTKFTLMINYGEYDLNNLPQVSNSNIYLRISFKKRDGNSAIDYCKKLILKGYKVFVNPMYTNTYSTTELQDLIQKVNQINPFAFAIVDTTGSIKEKELSNIYYNVESLLNKNIALCFHSHNNLQLSFSNAQYLIKNCKNRELIIDSCILGMGRGAGNLNTELLTKYINENYSGNYDIMPILKIANEIINPIFTKKPWGYSVPYYLSAVHNCHPDYAKYIINQQTVSTEIINQILKKIPNDKKDTFDENLIKQIYLEKHI